MVKYGRTDCLCHPLCETLLQRKWSRYGLPIFGLATILYFTFLLSLTMIVINHPSCLHKNYWQHEDNNHIFKDDSNRSTVCDDQIKNSYYVSREIRLMKRL
jgi:hypothetical protein